MSDDIVYVDEGGTPEEEDVRVEEASAATPGSRDAHLEEKVVELPSLTTAAALLEDDPLSSLPVEDADDETPPDPTPLTDKRYGPRGTSQRDEWDAKQRSLARDVEAEIASHPMIEQATAHDAVRLAQKKAIQEAFIKAQKAKAK